MVKKFSKNNLNKKRGISTIIGGMIFLVLLSAGFSTFFLAMDVQTDVIDAQQKMSDLVIDKTQEKFTVTASTDIKNNNRLGIHLKNIGSNPVSVENIWIVNNSGSFPAQKYDIEYIDANIPAGYGVDILENNPLYMTPDDYDIKVVSNLGTVKKLKLDVGGSNNLRATLIAIPPDVHINANVTLTLHVENIGETTLLNVKPAIDLPNITPAFDPPNPPAPTPVDLDPGESNFFTWNFIAKGGSVPEGTTVSFDVWANATEEGTGYSVASNNATTHAKMLEKIESEVIVLTQDLFSRPEMFMVIPSPFGDSDENPDERAIWGANIVNPTGNDMFVSKLVISAINPRPQSSDKVFERGKCELLTVEPAGAGAGDWSCSSDNQVTWKNQANPIQIAPYSVNPFLVQVKPGSIFGNTVDLEAIIVHTNVFTTLGEFGKAGYGSSMDTTAAPLVNVYHSEALDSLTPGDVLVNQTTTSNGIVVFNATLADFSTANTIDEDTTLIVNIPKGWTVNPASISAPDFTTSYQSFPDTSSQIVGTLDNDLVGGGAKTIKFYAQAPDVCSTQMYVMYVLADGTSNGGGFAIGPLAEILLRVTPVTVC